MNKRKHSSSGEEDFTMGSTLPQMYTVRQLRNKNELRYFLHGD
jgi:hypothetical protein